MITFIRLTIATFLLISNYYSQSDTTTFIQYHELRNNAIYDIEMKGGYESAYKDLLTITELHKTFYYKDLITITECAIALNKDSVEISKHIEDLFNIGVPLTELMFSLIIYDYLDANPQLTILKKESTLLNSFYASIDYQLFSEINYLKAKDELLRPYWKDSIARKIMLDVYHKNLMEVKTISLKYGFPGINTIGFLYKNLDIVLIHSFSSVTDSADFSEWDNILIKELFSYSISPSHYAIYVDTYNFRQYNTQVFGTTYITKNGKKIFNPEIKDINNIDKKRRAYGLMPLWKYAEISGIELPYNYEK